MIKVLKFRYGQDMSLFLLGHSFGGLIAADFVTSADYQNMIKGLINVDGSHNYPLNDTLTREKLLSTGQYEVSQNRNIDKWQPIINYCLSHKGNFSFEESQQLETYATDAENYIDSIKHINIVSQVLRYMISDKYPLTAMLTNLIYSEDSDFNKELAVTQFSSSLNKVTIPVLLLWGKYDFTCPVALGEDFFNRISSTDKKMVISAISGHNMILQDKKFFCDEVNAFVQAQEQINNIINFNAASMITKVFLLAIFGIAMAHLEGVVVVYLRKALGMLDSESNKESIEKFPKRFLKIEMTREAATIIMLVVIAYLTGASWIEKGVFFLWTFAFWDLFYYLSLYILIKWPPNFTTIDVLFLIPKPWIAPVWFPIGVSSLTIIIISILLFLIENFVNYLINMIVSKYLMQNGLFSGSLIFTVNIRYCL